MRVKLTPTFVAKAEPPENGDRCIFWDQERPGFGLMVTAGGHKSFVVQYRAGRRSRRIHLKNGLTLSDARKQARTILGAVAKGSDPLGERQKVTMAAANTLKAVCESYLAREAGMRRDAEGRATFKSGKVRRGQDRLAAFERLVYPKLGNRQIDDIKRTDIVRLLDAVEEERGPVMADQVLGYLRRVFAWHASRSDDFRSPIVRGMARTKPRDRARERTLTDDEIRIVWKTAEAFPGPFGALVRFVLLTATRRNEAARLVRGEISDNGQDWTIPAARYKSKQDHLVPLSVAARSLLAGIPAIGRSNDGYVFTTGGKTAISGFSKCKHQFDSAVAEALRGKDPKAKPLPNWTLHDLRRTARSLMSRAGVPSDHAERCLGHVIGGVRETYDRHSYQVEKKHAFEALAVQIERIINPQDNVVALRAPAQTG
jgi:integrase